MQFITLVAIAFANLALAAPGSVCTKAPYKAFLPLSNNPFIKSFCSKKFPVPAVTTTASTVSTTKTSTAFTTTTLSTTLTPTVAISTTETDSTTFTLSQTATETATVTTVISTTSTSTSTSTLTTTIVTDGNGAVYRREAEPTAAPLLSDPRMEARAAGVHGFNSNVKAQAQSRAFAALTQSVNPRLSSVLSTGCSCVETPQTLTATSTSTVFTTSTSTLSSTTTFTSPTTIILTQTTVQTFSNTVTTTATVTTTSSSTTTFTSAATATQTLQFNACGQSFPGPVTGETITVRCGQTISGTYNLLSSNTVANYYACLYAGDANYAVQSFTFQFSTKMCRLYSVSSGDAQSVANADFVYNSFY
ncbi:hypothetical protein HII31_10392 [Pseudocercospora fuligena]|uniref:Apple domain-containing protein n=1 Tax=Pseudocercospora fuligena TaxID=685502 RepID=A0A8H6RC18_9PEZI|nr:hypothetical protein HII31_10392 [Pseudocercospora fuligena]